MTKISQYTAITSLVNGDLIDTSQDVGGGLYQSKSIDFQDLQASIYFNRTINGINIKEVYSSSDIPTFPTALDDNTLYLFIGDMTFNFGEELVIGNNNVLLGLDAELSNVTYDGGGTFINCTNQDLVIRNLKISITTGTLLSAFNIDYTIDPLVDGFQGRNKRLQILNCNFAGAGFNLPLSSTNLGGVEGFATINFNANLITGFGGGLQISNGLSFEGLNNKLVLWSQVAGARMIDFRSNNWSGQTGGVGSYIPTGLNVLNISGNTFHPRATETAIYWDGLNATTQLGNISANVFIKELTSFIFAGATYGEIKEINIQGNQGLVDSSPYILVTMSGVGTIMPMPDTDAPIDLNANALITNSLRFTSTTNGRVTYEGVKDFYGLIIATLSIGKVGGGTDVYEFSLWEDDGGGFTKLPNATYTLGSDDKGNNFSITYSTFIEEGFSYEIRVTSASTDDVQILQMQLTIKE